MEPLISVIIPVYGVELYLRQCLDSVLAQTYPNLEILLVDDGSPDNGGAICDEYAAADSRIKVIHKQNGGLSDARNAGLAIASGEYIGFVDSDDWIAPDMYAYLYQGIRDYGADIALCEYYECWKNKYTAANRAETRVFRGRNAMDALLQLKIGNYAWNKLYKKSLWADVRYPVGKNYEDVRTAYKLVRQCGVVVALPEPKYYYRRTDESITGRHVLKNDVQRIESRIEQFENVADEFPEHTPFLLKILCENLGILRATVCRAGREEYAAYEGELAAVSAFLREHREEVFRSQGLGRFGRLAYSLMAKGGRENWRRSAQVESLYQWKSEKVNAYQEKQRLRGNSREERNIAYYYRRCLKLPLEKNAVFIESRGGEDFAGNMFFIAGEACRRGMQVYLSVWKDHMDKVRTIMGSGSFPGLTVVEKKSRPYYRALAASTYWFSDMVLEDVVIKRPGQVYVNTWHGTPLKTLEFDVKSQLQETGGAARDFLKCDYLAVPGDFVFDKLLSANGLENMFPGKELCSGSPRNSVFFDEEKRAEVRRFMGAEKQEVFVYMPTWRGSWTSHAGTDGEYSTEHILDFFEAHLGENQIMLVKLHNFAVDTIDFGRYEKIRPFPKEYDTYAVLNTADCLITDYSSVFFDFADTRRKIVLFTYDRQSYLQDRGLYLALEDLPFPKVNTYEEMLSELNTEIRYDDAAFVEAFCPYDGRDAAEKIFAQVVDGKDACPTRRREGNGKKNILIYDSGYGCRREFPAKAEALLAALSPEKANYYYSYRQWALQKAPGYLKSVPEGVRLFTTPLTTMLSPRERKYLEKRGFLPQKVVRREKERVFHGDSFDEIYVLDDNKYDPYYPVMMAGGRPWKDADGERAPDAGA